MSFEFIRIVYSKPCISKKKKCYTIIRLSSFGEMERALRAQTEVYFGGAILDKSGSDDNPHANGTIKLLSLPPLISQILPFPKLAAFTHKHSERIGGRGLCSYHVHLR